jgi:predicted transcriptional regulator
LLTKLPNLEQLQEPEINQTHTPGKLKVLSVEIHWFCFYYSLDRKLDLLIGKIAGVSPGESKLNKDGIRAYLQM